jgi:hypothetical protein
LGGPGSIIGKKNQSQHFNQIINSGDIVLTVEANDIIAALSGSGDITLKGKYYYESKLSGSGDIGATELEL